MNKYHRLFLVFVFLFAPNIAFAGCDLGCDAKCRITIAGVKGTEPYCYTNCKIAETTCTTVAPVVQPIAKVVAENLGVSFAVAPSQSTAILFLNLVIADASGLKIGYPVIPIPPNSPDSTGIKRNIGFDCLYLSSPNGVDVYMGVSSAAPAGFGEIKKGDDITATGTNANCAAKEGQRLVPQGAFRAIATVHSDEYIVFGRPVNAISAVSNLLRQTGGSLTAASKSLEEKSPTEAKVEKPTTAIFGVVETKGSTVVVRLIDPRRERSFEIPKDQAKVEPTGVKVKLPKSTREVEISKVIVNADAKVVANTASTLADITSMNPEALSLAPRFTPSYPQPVPGESTQRPMLLSNYPGDIACGIAKTTPIYWQAYALVKLAKDNGFISNANQCNDAKYTATVIAAILGGGVEVIEALTAIYGACICHDLY